MGLGATKAPSRQCLLSFEVFSQHVFDIPSSSHLLISLKIEGFGLESTDIIVSYLSKKNCHNYHSNATISVALIRTT